MPLTIGDIIANPARLEELRPPIETCSVCAKRLQETVTGRHETDAGVVCSDHYYERLGDIIELHPIVSGGVRRG